MSPRRNFLTARWCHLVLANYPVPDELVRPYLPPGVEPDRRDGSAWCSLVGFQFLDTRVLGVGWPGYRHFPEWTRRPAAVFLISLHSLAICNRTIRTNCTE